jgi:O-antigen/teichoic acid export membrane protein
MIKRIRDGLDRLRRLLQRSPFARNVTSTFAVQIVTLVIATANAAVIARLLGPSGKGILALTVLVPSVLALFLSGGIGVANVYFAGQRRFDVPTLTGNAMAFTLVATLLGIVVTIAVAMSGLLSKLLPGIPLGLLVVAMLGLPFNLLNGYFTTILQGLQQISRINVVTLFQRACTFSLTILFVVVLHWNLVGAVLAVVLSLAASVVILAVLLKRRGASFWPRWNRPVMRTTLHFGLRGYVANVLQFFNYRLDLFLVNYFLGPSGVGIYTVAVSMGEMLWYLPNAVSFVIFPKAANTSKEVMNRFTPRVFRTTLLLTALGAVGLALVGRPFIEIVYSADFLAAYIPMLVLLPGIVLLGGGKVLTNEVAGRGYPQYNSLASGVSLILTVVLDLMLIPRFGVVGASAASTMAYATIFVLAIVFYSTVSKQIGEPPATSSP